MAYTETTTNSYGSRLGKSFGGIGTGFLMFLAGTALLWWNEGRAVKTDKMLNEAQGVTVEMEDINRIDQELEGKLIHATGLATTTDSIVDPNFNVGSVAINLGHTVEYYQWRETAHQQKKDKLGGGEEVTTTYTYSQGWTNAPVNSSAFKDPAYQGKNFTLFNAEDARVYAENVTFGAYKLTSGQVQSISGKSTFDVTFPDEQVRTWNGEAQRVAAQRSGTNVGVGNAVENSMRASANSTSTDGNATNVVDYPYVHVSGGTLYFGASPNSPQVGDVRITFFKTDPATVSLMAVVSGDTFKPFKAKNGKTFSTLVMGEKTADEMYESEHQANNMWLWILRIVGIMIVIGGLKGIFGILTTLMKVIPFLSKVVGAGVGFICTVVGIIWSLIIIALAWLFYRPLIGIIILAVAGAFVFFLIKRGREKSAAAAANSSVTDATPTNP